MIRGAQLHSPIKRQISTIFCFAKPNFKWSSDENSRKKDGPESKDAEEKLWVGEWLKILLFGPE